MSPSKMPPQFKKMVARKAGKPEPGETKKHEKSESPRKERKERAKCEKEEED